MQLLNNHFYEFGAFRLDAQERVLWRANRPVPLTPKVFDLLLVLVENRGRLLEKDELLQKVWPDSFVEEANLSVNISVLRRALGEVAGETQFIETVPRRGYRFMAEVREAERPGDGAPERRSDDVAEMIIAEHTRTSVIVEEQEEKTDERQNVIAGVLAEKLLPATAARVTVSKIMAAVVLIGLLAGIAYWWKLRQPASEQAVPPAIKSLAVLPFKSLKPESGDEYLRVGIADVMITRLSNISALAVRPTTSVLRFADSDPLQAGRDLKVDSVLDGSIQQVGDRVRVTVRLVRVADGQSLWAYQCDQQCNDVFQLQDTISTKVTEALALKLSGNERERLAQRYTSNQAAWEAYAKGRYYRNRAGTAGYAKALASFQQAVQADPKFALAFAALAEAYYWSSSSVTNMGEAMAKAKEAAQRALALDDELAEAHTALGVVHFMYDWQFPAAEQELKRAVALNPGSPDVQMWYGKYLALMGRFDESIVVMQRAAALDPVSPLTAPESTFPYFLKGNYDEAIAGNAMNARPDLPSVTLRGRNGKENFSPFRNSHIENFNVGPANRE